MVCSKLDSASEVRNMEGQQDSDKNGAMEMNVRELEILTLEGKMLKVNVEKNTTVRAVKIDCELLCGVPSDLQILQCSQGRELDNDATFGDLELPHGCPLRLTVPQWWLKFVCTCFKGHTLQVRKRIFVKMNQMSREERTFTAAFIAAIKGNHSLLFAAFAGRKVNVNSRAELSGRTLLHAAISGGSTSCVANILMNGGSVLLETPDNAGETPVQMALKLHGIEGEIVNFLNIYLELHQREKKNSSYWDDLEQNNINNRDVDISVNQTEYSEKNGFECGKAEHGFEYSVDRNPEANLDEHSVALKRCAETEPINNSIFVNDTNVNDYEALSSDKRALIPASVSAETGTFNRLRQETRQTPDTENRANHEEIAEMAERSAEMFNNEELFTQKAKIPIVMTKQVNLGDQTDGDDVTNLSMVSATSGESDIGNSPKLPRRAHMRKQAFLEQRRKRSTTERPNIRQLIIPDKSCYDETSNDDSNEEESNDRRGTSLTANDVLRVWQRQDTTTDGSGKSNCEGNVTSSPKPLRRAHLRKQAFLEQHRKRSATERPCLGQLATVCSIGSGGETTSEVCDNLEREEGGCLDACQDQEVTNVSMTSYGDDCNASHSPKLQRRAHQRKQAFLEQRRRMSTTERSNIDQPIILDTKGRYVADNEDAAKYTNERDRTSVQTSDVSYNLQGLCSNMDGVPDKKELSIKLSSSEGSDRPKQLSPLPPASKNHNHLPVRRFRRRYLQSSPTSEAKQLVEDVSSQGSWSSVSGDDSEDSSREQNVFEETVARVSDPLNIRRRRLPLVPLPDKKLKLPVIRIEGSGDSETHSHQMSSSDQMTRVRNSSVEDPTSPTYDVPHRSALPISRPRSGSTCSEDSLSSGETPLVRSRAHSEGENVVPIKTVATNLRTSKSCPVRHRRTSVPNSAFDQNLQTRGRRYSVQVEQLNDQGYQVNPQLRSRLATGGIQRERMPWNQWRAVKRTAFINDESDGENSEDDNLQQKGRSTEAYDSTLREKKQRVKSGKPSGISFAEWLESKEALIKTRPESARPRSDSLGQTNINERQLQATEKYQEWLKRKDQEALEKEERLLFEGRRSYKRHTKQIQEESRRGSQGSKINTER